MAPQAQVEFGFGAGVAAPRPSDALQPPITFDEARALAESVARFHLGAFQAGSTPLLAERHLQAEHCWMFFQNRAIAVPPEGLLRVAAYAVSRRGTCRSVPDLSDEPGRLAQYLHTMSNYFSARFDDSTRYLDTQPPA